MEEYEKTGFCTSLELGKGQHQQALCVYNIIPRATTEKKIRLKQYDKIEFKKCLIPRKGGETKQKQHLKQQTQLCINGLTIPTKRQRSAYQLKKQQHDPVICCLQKPLEVH